MSPVRYISHPSGPRCYVFGRRLHHGLAGVGLMAASYPARRTPLGRGIAAAGLVLAAHDRRDFPFRDTDNH